MAPHRISLNPDQLAAVMDALRESAGQRADGAARKSSKGPLDAVDIQRRGAAHRIWSVYDAIKRQVNQPQCTCNPQHRGYCQLAEHTEDATSTAAPDLKEAS